MNKVAFKTKYRMATRSISKYNYQTADYFCEAEFKTCDRQKFVFPQRRVHFIGGKMKSPSFETLNTHDNHLNKYYFHSLKNPTNALK